MFQPFVFIILKVISYFTFKIFLTARLSVLGYHNEFAVDLSKPDGLLETTFS